MTEKQPFVRRSDFSIEENVEQGDNPFLSPITTWEASFYGTLFPSGENVSLTRHGATFKEALTSLETVITNNGWRISG